VAGLTLGEGARGRKTSSMWFGLASLVSFFWVEKL
jgi:hypothetical protein